MHGETVKMKIVTLIFKEERWSQFFVQKSFQLKAPG